MSFQFRQFIQGVRIQNLGQLGFGEGVTAQTEYIAKVLTASTWIPRYCLQYYYMV